MIDSYNDRIPNIYALSSDTNILRIQYEYNQKQCVGVAIKGMDIRYMVVTSEKNVFFSIFWRQSWIVTVSF